MDRGFAVYQIVGRVFVVNIALAALAALTILNASLPVHVIALIAGCGIVGLLLWIFETGNGR